MQHASHFTLHNFTDDTAMSSSANMATATKIEVTRHSLEPPCGLPSPTFSNTGKLSTGPKPSSRPHIHITALIDDDLTDDVNFDGPESHTLISCLTHLSLSSLSSQTAGPVITRFPAPPPPVPSSLLGSREEQRRIYLGPKLSDRATGGPDAGPLIERFSCLFKDRVSFSRSRRISVQHLRSSSVCTDLI